MVDLIENGTDEASIVSEAETFIEKRALLNTLWAETCVVVEVAIRRQIEH